MKLSLLAAALSTALLLCPISVFADDTTPVTHAEVEAIVKKVIEDNPELIIQAVEKYQVKKHAEELTKASQNITTMEADIKNNPNSPMVGNPKGDVTIVEFFDYHCGYCKHFYPEVSKIIADDKNVRVVFKEFPILSEDSVTAAKAALAVWAVDKSKYFAYHSALMQSSGAFTSDMLEQTAKDVGIDVEKFKKAMNSPEIDKEIAHNKELAQSLNIEGTPAIIIGTELVTGAIGMDAFKAKIAATRAANEDKK